MLTANDLRIRDDPGPEFAWHVRIWWQHTDTYVCDEDLVRFHSVKGTIRDAVAVAGT